ncbi:uncharacterized protein PGTG_21884 [Puccinia graminis f. sp. tritici CRL 75-36-700-3]|uniref:Uncharacterized protein n=1 Tax=Puccinia graminis f. sp. tritici (strain CRL 75-36-700-3 / race SCCL) TaxID=418459 RepID=H6QSV6_PUCGT|nr:uncharacterized protein PGTG_21884 [Puccinia graminis f. sp. tritici CRL 75-36-700-3]EHS63845.1 hypothetical protein PGTG_21884 [Puccinia graminis f. sp. tritici CRL 75-36-700-3]
MTLLTQRLYSLRPRGVPLGLETVQGLGRENPSRPSAMEAQGYPLVRLEPEWCHPGAQPVVGLSGWGLVTTRAPGE